MSKLRGDRNIVEAADYVSLRDLDEGGIEIVVDASRERFWAMPVMVIIAGVVLIIAGRQFGGARGPGLATAPFKLGMLGWMNVGIGLLLALIRLQTGPARNVVLQARPGRLTADRSIAGDRVVSNYGRDEVRALFVDANQLWVSAAKGEMPLIAFGERDVNRAIAGLLGALLWEPAELAEGLVSVGGTTRWVVMPREIEQPPGVSGG
jgi:hypothetical protein